MAAGTGAVVAVAASIEGNVASDSENHSNTVGPGSKFLTLLEGSVTPTTAEDLDALFCRGGQPLSRAVTTAPSDEGRLRGSFGSRWPFAGASDP